MQLFLGVDGGQSGTTALIADQNGRILGRGEAGPCNHAGTAAGRTKLASAVSQSIAGACGQAGLDASSLRFAVACFGMSGGPDDKLSILREIVPADLVVSTDDASIALAGATRGEPGIAVIAGTGSIAFGRNAAGRTARAGGWGYVFGDEGSAFDIVRQAVRAALQFEEGWGTPSGLHARWAEATGSTDANAAMHRFYTDEWPRSRVAALAPLVDEAARSGDPLAAGILNQAAQQLAMLAAAVRAHLWRPGESVRVAWIGGVFRSDLLRERFRDLVELEEGALAGPPEFGPPEGALLEAYRAAGLHPRLMLPVVLKSPQ